MSATAALTALLIDSDTLSRWAAVTAAFLVVGVILSTIHSLSRRLWQLEDRLFKDTRTVLGDLIPELHSMHVILQRYPQCMMPMTGWTMGFRNIHSVLDLLDQLAPSTIVEFGSGMSTLCVGAWLKARGRGHLYSFDHDAEWAEVTRRYICANDLEDFAEIILRPLRDVPTSDGGKQQWYDINSQVANINNIDLVIVDGPPAGTVGSRTSRSPALSALYDRLSPVAAIILDDAKREGEREVVRKWAEQFPDFTIRTGGGTTGIAILQRKGFESGNTARAVASDVNRV